MSIWDDYKQSSLNPVNLFKHDDPQAAANKYLSQIPGVGQKYYNPFIESGSQAGSLLQGQYGKLLNPTSFIDELMKNYSLSKGAQYKRDELGRGIGATAAAGGFAGTPEHEKEYGTMSDQIMSEDMQQYLENALRVYGTGLSGEQDIYGKGYSASGDMADLLGGTLSSQAGLGFQNASQNNADRSAFMNALVKALTTAGGAYAGAV